MIGSLDTTPMVRDRRREYTPDDGDVRLRRSDRHMRRRDRRRGSISTRRAFIDALDA